MVSLPPLERGVALLELAVSRPDGFSYKDAHRYLGVSTATVARLLKVLVQMDYLVQERTLYKAGPGLARLAPGCGGDAFLDENGPALAAHLANQLNESCVVAACREGRFEFVGVEMVEGSLAYAPTGRVIEATDGHVLSLIIHAAMDPREVWNWFAERRINFGPGRELPAWHEYASAIVHGLETGHFLEFGWRRDSLYRTAVPIFSVDARMIGAFFCGFSSRQMLMENLDRVMGAGYNALVKLPDYSRLFQAGLASQFRPYLQAWQRVLANSQS